MYTREDSLNARNYADHFKIAQNAMKTIEKIKHSSDVANKERPDETHIYFTAPQLITIAYDYAFAALENFLEHIGFILFDDWDSAKSQRHYTNKKDKLLAFKEIIETNLPNSDFPKLETEWLSIINSIDPGAYHKMRNPLKHVHAGKHDAKKQTVSANSTSMNPADFEKLVSGTRLELTEADCQQLIHDVDGFIIKLHAFIKANIIIFRIYCNNNSDEIIETRKSLLRIFEAYPYAETLYTSTTTTA